MPKTLSPDDPNLLKAVQRLKRANWIWGGLLIGLGVLTQWTQAPAHPLTGLPLIIIGLACVRFAEPALLAAAGLLIVLSIPAYLNPNLTLLGPDPLPRFVSPAGDEFELRLFLAAFTLGKLILAYMAFNQFVLMRFLYGTERAWVDDPRQSVIPPMVPNRLNGILRWALWLALGSLGALAVTLVLWLADPSGLALRLGAELTGSLGALALALGVGVAFSPTDFRGVATLTMGLGMLAYISAALFLLLLP
jgi:hypothetical protein